MKGSKKLPCELCAFMVPIRSTIKEGVHKGKKACPICKSKHVTKPLKKQYRIKHTSKKAALKRKVERKDFPKFFEAAIAELFKRPFCENCGEHIQINYMPVHNIAHILNKSKYKSVSTDPENYLLLCAAKDNRNACHEKFDGAPSDMVQMPVFELAKEKFEKFKDKVTEKGKLFHIFNEK